MSLPSVSEFPKPDGFQDIARTQFNRSRSLRQGEMSNQGLTTTFHTNDPTKCRLPTPYGFRDIAQTEFNRSRSLRQGQMSNQGHTMRLNTFNPQPMSLPSITFLHLTVSEI